MTDANEALSILTRGTEGIFSSEELRRKLESGRPLRVKLGMDPTAPDIHLGHSVVLRKLRQFQDLGHVAVLIIGDYTARIGDPTGRDATRPVLDEQVIQHNAHTYLEQAGKVLDTATGKLEVRHNSEWLAKMTFADVLFLTGQVTVQQMLHRENFKLRLEHNREIVLSEFMYPLMQGYDSVVINADVELGGTDQTFNNLMGRELMGKAGQEKQVVMVMPLLVGLDGHEKMSKSRGNYVAVTHPPQEMFGRIMSIPDTLMDNYFHLLTDLPDERIRSLVNPHETHPREAKDTLARVIVEEFYDVHAANHASTEFRRQFADKELPANLEEKPVPAASMVVVNLLRHVGFAASNSEARRLVEQGGVTLGDQKVSDPRAELSLANNPVLRVGKRRVCRVVAPDA